MNKIFRLCYIQFSLLLCLIIIFSIAVPVKADQKEEHHQSSERSEPKELTGSTDDNYLENVEYESPRSEDFKADTVTTDHQPEKDDPDVSDYSELKTQDAFNDPEDDLTTDAGFSSDSIDPGLGMESSDQADFLQHGIINPLSAEQDPLDNPVYFTDEQQPLIISLPESSPTMQKIDDYWVIETFAHLNEVREALSDKYRLANDIQMTGDWIPIGTSGSPFSGFFDGSNFTISNLLVSGGSNYAGLFGYVSSSTIQNLNLEIESISGGDYTGGLAGRAYSSTIDNCFVSVSLAEDRKISGKKYVGGLTGFADRSLITRCSVEGMITGSDNYLGGLVGYSDRSEIDQSFSETIVQGSKGYVGGLVGAIVSSDITNSYSKSTVSGNNGIGGLVGFLLADDSNIDNSYAAGSVSGVNHIGGLIGRSAGTNNISFCHSTSFVNNINNGIGIGGFIGSSRAGSIPVSTNNYWGIEDSGQSTSVIGMGLSCEAMKTENCFIGFDFDQIWFIDDSLDYPILKWQLDESPPNPDDPDEPGGNPGESDEDGDGGGGPGGDDDDDNNDYPFDPTLVGNSDPVMMFDQIAKFNSDGLFFKLLSMIRQIEKLIVLILEAGDYRQADIKAEIDLLFVEITELFETNRFRLSPAEEQIILDKLESIAAALAAY